ncbi:MAG: undecaprenyl-diphosphate phosphatase [Pirellulales bacterium]|nr:undecaprenyl-diphosphate phosphatase [Pirellulales bacterium]
MEYLYTIIMGIVEGITEFLPISSTGHLILADGLLGFEEHVGGKEFADAFKIIIQLGAILAVVAAYPGRFLGLLDFNKNQGLAGIRGLALLAITSFPAAFLGLLADKAIEKYLFYPLPVAAALAVGAVWILLVERFLPAPKKVGVDSLTWKEALSVGCFQCLSLWPGMSRSTSTILGGMLSGLERKTATEYSFFAAVPIMLAATVYKLYQSGHLLTGERFTVLALGFAVSFVFAWLAVKLFIRFLGRHTLVPFGWYRLALAALVALYFLISDSI